MALHSFYENAVWDYCKLERIKVGIQAFVGDVEATDDLTGMPVVVQE
ncbi:MAG: hypothetical protein GY801_14435 [bacterium]|nr:hypothetical protein [bacterium]